MILSSLLSHCIYQSGNKSVYLGRKTVVIIFAIVIGFGKISWRMCVVVTSLHFAKDWVAQTFPLREQFALLKKFPISGKREGTWHQSEPINPPTNSVAFFFFILWMTKKCDPRKLDAKQTILLFLTWHLGLPEGRCYWHLSAVRCRGNVLHRPCPVRRCRFDRSGPRQSSARMMNKSLK